MRRSVLIQFDRDAYKPIFCKAERALGRLVLIGVNRRPQKEVERRRAARLSGNPIGPDAELDA